MRSTGLGTMNTLTSQSNAFLFFLFSFPFCCGKADGDDDNRWRMAENSTLYSALTMGAWFRELQGHMNGKIDGSNNVEYFHKWVAQGFFFGTKAVWGIAFLPFRIF